MRETRPNPENENLKYNKQIQRTPKTAPLI